MSNQRIIYKDDTGNLCIITPTQEAIDLYGIDAIALKDVPFGKPYKIIDFSELPEDRTFRDAWEVSDEMLTDGFGADYSEFPQEAK